MPRIRISRRRFTSLVLNVVRFLHPLESPTLHVPRVTQDSSIRSNTIEIPFWQCFQASGSPRGAPNPLINSRRTSPQDRIRRGGLRARLAQTVVPSIRPHHLRATVLIESTLIRSSIRRLEAPRQRWFSIGARDDGGQ